MIAIDFDANVYANGGIGKSNSEKIIGSMSFNKEKKKLKQQAQKTLATEVCVLNNTNPLKQFYRC